MSDGTPSAAGNDVKAHYGNSPNVDHQLAISSE